MNSFTYLLTVCVVRKPFYPLQHAWTKLTWCLSYRMWHWHCLTVIMLLAELLLSVWQHAMVRTLHRRVTATASIMHRVTINATVSIEICAEPLWHNYLTVKKTFV